MKITRPAWSLFRRFAAFSSVCLLTAAQAVPLYWDGDGAGVVGGGSGNWNTSGTTWSTTAGGSTYQAWVNGNNDDAVFQNTAGTVTLNAAVTAKSVTFGSTGYTLAGASALTLGATGTGVIDTGAFSATISAPVAGTVGLTKIGSGTLILSGAKSYTGTTTVSAGALRVNGTLAAVGAVTVSNSATLGGDGTVSGPVTTAVGGRLDPGTLAGTIATFTLSNGLTWNGSGDGSATMYFDLDAAGVGDRIAVTGNLVKGSGTIYRFDFRGTGSPGRYTLIQATGTHNLALSDLSYINLGATLSGSFDVSDAKKIVFVIGNDVPPAIAIAAPSLSSTNSGPVTFTVTYTDDNFANSTLAVENITLLKTGTANGTVSVDAGTGAIRTVTLSDLTGAGTLAIAIAEGTGVDATGKLAPAAGPSATVAVSNTVPTFTSASSRTTAYRGAFTYTVTTSAPATLTATSLPPGLVFDATAGIISGEPSAVGNFNILLGLTDVFGNQNSMTLALNVTQKAVTVSGLTVVPRPYDGGTSATLNAAGVQLVGLLPADVGLVTLSTAGAVANFLDPNAGTSKPVTLNGLSLAGAPAANYLLTPPVVTGTIIGNPATVTLSNLSQVYDGSAKSVTVVTNPAVPYTVTYNGSSTAPTNAGTYAVVANTASPTFSGEATGTLVIAPANQTITFAALPNRQINDAPFAVSATASSGLSVNLAVSGPASLVGSNVALTGAEGLVTVTASQPGNGNYAAATTVVRSFTVTSLPAPGVYLGTISGDRSDAAFGLLVRPDYSGVFAGYLPTLGIGLFTQAVQVDRNGDFSARLTTTGTIIAMTLRGRVSGSGTVTGSFDPFALTFSGTSSGPASLGLPGGESAGLAAVETAAEGGFVRLAATTANSGVYRLSLVGTSGTTNITGFVGADGRAYIFSSDGVRSAGAAATVSGTTTSATLSDQSRVVLTFAPGGSAEGTYTPSGGTAQRLVGGTEVAGATQRLINMSTRGRTSAGESTLIASFVLRGDAAKRVLIRVAGPALANFEVPAFLVNPSLELYAGSTSGSTLIASNDDWGTSPDPTIASLMLSAGAFSFGGNSRDAALVTKLNPGSYSVFANGGAGVVITEIYELLETGETPGVRRLVNISARGSVGVPGEPLTAGFVIGGALPKKVLLRGVGPGIASVLSSAVANPRLRLYRRTNVIKENDDWFRDADAPAISAAATAVGAFPLGAQSLDAAMVVVLEPGAYTAQVDSVTGATGLGLVEVYEVP
ncbi:MAG: hypothetical protein RIQ93_1070 [Verrucomicrobiota bacterium]|jgi:autotransporter-associated beta strand protein